MVRLALQNVDVQQQQLVIRMHYLHDFHMSHPRVLTSLESPGCYKSGIGLGQIFHGMMGPVLQQQQLDVQALHLCKVHKPVLWRQSISMGALVSLASILLASGCARLQQGCRGNEHRKFGSSSTICYTTEIQKASIVEG